MEVLHVPVVPGLARTSERRGNIKYHWWSCFNKRCIQPY